MQRPRSEDLLAKVRLGSRTIRGGSNETSRCLRLRSKDKPSKPMLGQPKTNNLAGTLRRVVQRRPRVSAGAPCEGLDFQFFFLSTVTAFDIFLVLLLGGPYH